MKLEVLCLCFVGCLSIFMGRSVVDCQTQQTAQEAGGIVFVLCGMFVDLYGKICC